MAIEGLYGIGNAYEQAKATTRVDAEERTAFMRDVKQINEKSEEIQAQKALISKTASQSTATDVTKGIAEKSLYVRTRQENEEVDAEIERKLDMYANTHIFVTDQGHMRAEEDENYNSSLDMTVFIDRNVAKYAEENAKVSRDIAGVVNSAEQKFSVFLTRSDAEYVMQAHGLSIDSNEEVKYFALMDDVEKAEGTTLTGAENIPAGSLAEIIMREPGAKPSDGGYRVFMGGTVQGLLRRITLYMKARGWSIPASVHPEETDIDVTA